MMALTFNYGLFEMKIFARTVENAVDTVKKGASDYISKPFKIPTLLTIIRRVLEEARFEECGKKLDFDQALGSLASPIRRDILKLLANKGHMRLMDLTRDLNIEDHTKVIFHLRNLREAGVIEQDDKKCYLLTTEGRKTLSCLKTIEQMLIG